MLIDRLRDLLREITIEGESSDFISLDEIRDARSLLANEIDAYDRILSLMDDWG